jgi:hypothetical protein
VSRTFVRVATVTKGQERHRSSRLTEADFDGPLEPHVTPASRLFGSEDVHGRVTLTDDALLTIAADPTL